MTRPPHIMSLVWYKVLPAQFGGQKGIADFNEALGKQANLVCLCSRDNEPGSARHYQVFNWLPVGKSQVVNLVALWTIIRFARQHKITHAIIEHPYHLPAAMLLKWLVGCRIINHSHNIEYERFRQHGKWYWPVLRWVEKKLFRLSTVVIFKTEEDRTAACRLFGLPADTTAVVHYGTTRKNLALKAACKSEVCQRHGIPSHQKIVLFNGTLDYWPNAAAATELVTQVAPLLPQGYTIIITGRNDRPVTNLFNRPLPANVVFTGRLADVEPYFLAADVYANPVATGGGMQTKNIEAISYGLNVVCRQHMLQGIALEVMQGKVFSIPSGDVAAFADAVQQAAHNPLPVADAFFEYYSFDRQVADILRRL